MTRAKSVECTVKGFSNRSKPYQIKFDIGKDCFLEAKACMGRDGVSEIACDLLDFATAIYFIEKNMTGNRRTNPPEMVKLSIKLRKPEAWTEKAVEKVRAILSLLGNADWDIHISGGLKRPIPEKAETTAKKIQRIVLFSGGMDSTCGLMSPQILSQKDNICLVSFYTRQKTLQSSLAKDLGYPNFIQWGRKLNMNAGRGKSFYYRSFLFLSLAAVVAESYGIREIVQFENGVLATAIPPSPAWRMTKHAHPLLHLLMQDFLAELLGGEWKIANPFLLHTKRECFEETVKTVGEKERVELIKKTETCWYHYSNRVIGGYYKEPNKPCGFCIPCINRRTAFDHDDYAWDLCKDEYMNDDIIGINFRSYYGFAAQIQDTKDSKYEFYKMLPSCGREIIALNSELTLDNLHGLFLRFSEEFLDTYKF